jgi:heme iron utilization protein
MALNCIKVHPHETIVWRFNMWIRSPLLALAELLAPEAPETPACRAVYLQRFPDAEPMTFLAEFHFVRLHLQGARQVAGFGAARSLDGNEVRRALGPAS